MHSQNRNCEQLEPLLSAMLDGELPSPERDELIAHLAHCAECQSNLHAFKQVNEAVVLLSRADHRHENCSGGLSALNGVPGPMKFEPSAHRTRLFSVWRLVPLAVAATMLLCLAITALPEPEPASAEQIPAEQFVEPMKEFLANNIQQQRDQDLMIRTLGWDLRAMKLDLNQLEPGSDERISLEAQIDAMIAKVNQFENETNLVSTDK